MELKYKGDLKNGFEQYQLLSERFEWSEELHENFVNFLELIKFEWLFEWSKELRKSFLELKEIQLSFTEKEEIKFDLFNKSIFICKYYYKYEDKKYNSVDELKKLLFN